MDAGTILDLANRAARHVRRRFDLQWSYEDFEDACQESACGIVRALRDAPDGVSDGYFFKAGVQGATRYAFRRTSLESRTQYPLHSLGRIETRGGGDILATIEMQPIEAQSRGWASPLSGAQIATLRRILSRCPHADGARGGPRTRDQSAVARDLVILVGLSRGLSQSEIGKELGLPKGHVHKYQQKLRRRLAAAGEGV